MNLTAYRIASDWLSRDTVERRQLLARDILDVANEQRFEHDAQGLYDAARILLARIGGRLNVPGYVDCLEAGERNRKA